MRGGRARFGVRVGSKRRGSSWPSVDGKAVKREVSLRWHPQDLGVSRVRGYRVRSEATLLALGTREMAVTSLEKRPQRGVAGPTRVSDVGCAAP